MGQVLSIFGHSGFKEFADDGKVAFAKPGDLFALS